MNLNAHAIITLCSHMCVGEGVVPLEPKEWSALAKQLMENQLQPGDLLGFSEAEMKERLLLGTDQAQRLARLIDRSASLSFELSQYENMGIYVITRADEQYPKRLKKNLGNQCPPLFYYAGDLGLLDCRAVGYAGSRSVGEEDIAFTKQTVGKTVRQGYGVVSGGAKGIDSIAENEALSCGSTAIAYLSDSLLKKMKSSAVIRPVQDGKLVLLSVVKPDAGFQAGIAMMRNRYIYAQSSGTVIVRSDYNKGGTWSGAVENLKHGWCPEFCWDQKHYPGNKALIQQGAYPIDAQWDADVMSKRYQNINQDQEQLSLFDL